MTLYRFRTDKIGEQECPSCNGNVRVFVFGCRLHGACTEAKPLWPETDGRYRVCATCPDRDACTGASANAKVEWLLASARKMRDGFRVERLAAQPTANEFFRRWWNTATPVVFPTKVPAWTFDDLAARFGGAEVEVQTGREADPFYERRSHQHKSRMNFGGFLRRCVRESTNDIYMTANNAAANRELLAKLLLEALPVAGIVENPAGGFFWVSPAGAVTPTHHDLTCNLLVMVRGKKRVLLVAPEWTPLMQNDLHVYSRIDLANPSLPDGIVPVEVIIKAGDALFLPVGWWHHVTTLEPSIMLSYTNFAGVRNDFWADHPRVG